MNNKLYIYCIKQLRCVYHLDLSWSEPRLGCGLGAEYPRRRWGVVRKDGASTARIGDKHQGTRGNGHIVPKGSGLTPE